MIAEQTGVTKPRAIALPSKAFFSEPVVVARWQAAAARGQPSELVGDRRRQRRTRGEARYRHLRRPGRRFDAVWSPDSQWIAYSKSLDSHLRAIFLYSIADKRAHQVTDGLSDATAPAFDASGKYLYFLASTNYALRISWLEMSSVDRPATRAVYLAVLSASEPSPLLPETGDEPVRGAGDGGKPAPPPPVRVDIKGIDQRILALGVPAGDYAVLAAGPAGSVVLPGNAARRRTGAAHLAPLPVARAHEPRRFSKAFASYTLSGDGKKLLYRAGRRIAGGVVVTDRPAKVGEGARRSSSRSSMR